MSNSIANIPKKWQECHNHFASLSSSFITAEHPKYQAWNSVWGLRIHTVYIKDKSEFVCTLVDYQNLSITLVLPIVVEKFTSEFHKLSECVFVYHTTTNDIILNLSKCENFRLIANDKNDKDEFNFRLCKSCQKLNYGPNNFTIKNKPHLIKMKEELEKDEPLNQLSETSIKSVHIRMIIKIGDTISFFHKNYTDSKDKIYDSDGNSTFLDQRSMSESIQEKCGPFFVSNSTLIHAQTFEKFRGSLLLKCIKFYSKSTNKIICVYPDNFKVLVRVLELKPVDKKFIPKQSHYLDVDKTIDHYYHFDEDSQKLFYLSYDGSIMGNVDV
jgi:hypothetical protein